MFDKKNRVRQENLKAIRAVRRSLLPTVLIDATRGEKKIIDPKENEIEIVISRTARGLRRRQPQQALRAIWKASLPESDD